MFCESPGLWDSSVCIAKAFFVETANTPMYSRHISEEEAIFESGMGQAGYFHIDDTRARHKGINHYAHVVCDEKRGNV